VVQHVFEVINDSSAAGEEEEEEEAIKQQQARLRFQREMDEQQFSMADHHELPGM
jgi:hypothetical protein